MSGINRSSIQNKKSKYSYKIYLVKELNGDDLNRQIQFYKTIGERVTNVQQFPFNVCFFDEYLNGTVNHHKMSLLG